MLIFCFHAFAFRLSSLHSHHRSIHFGTCLQKLAIAALLSALAFASDVLPLLSLLESELEMSFGPQLLILVTNTSSTNNSWSVVFRKNMDSFTHFALSDIVPFFTSLIPLPVACCGIIFCSLFPCVDSWFNLQDHGSNRHTFFSIEIQHTLGALNLSGKSCKFFVLKKANCSGLYCRFCIPHLSFLLCSWKQPFCIRKAKTISLSLYIYIISLYV